MGEKQFAIFGFIKVYEAMRRALRKQAPTRGVWCNGGRSGRSGVFIVGGGGRLFWTCHIAPLWRMKTNPAVHVSASGSRQMHTWRGPCGGFSGENLWCWKAEAKCCNLVYLETWGPWKRVAPCWNVTPDRFQVYCLKASAVARGAWTWMVFCCNLSPAEHDVPAVPPTDTFTSHTASQHLPIKTQYSLTSSAW